MLLRSTASVLRTRRLGIKGANAPPVLLTNRTMKDVAVSFREPDRDPSSKRWTAGTDRRTGALALKLGMIPVWDVWGERHACTVLFLDNNRVVQVKTKDRDGYDAVQVGAGAAKPKNVKRTLRNHVRRWTGDAYHPAPDVMREFRIDGRKGQAKPDGEPPMLRPNDRIHARHFVPGQLLDVSGVSKGKGFQGGMKRHGFKGMPASHGTSLSHRAIGSTGACQDPGKVWKGKKMPGRMGNDRVTVHNLRLFKIDAGRDLLYVKGAVPGQNGKWIEVRDAVRQSVFGTDKVLGGVSLPPVPTFFPGEDYDANGSYDFEGYVDGTGEKGLEINMPFGDIDPFAPEEIAG